MVRYPPQGTVTEVSDDLSPVLGGNLNANTNSITNIRDFGFMAIARKELATGIFTTTQVFHSIDGEGDTDDTLVTIQGGNAGELLIIRPDDDAATITVADTGNIILAGDADFVMSDIADTMFLLFDGTNWLELSRSSNHA